MNFKKAGSLVGIIILTIIVFFPSLHGGYLNWDDNMQIFENPDVTNLSLQSIKNYFTTFYVSSYQPLASFSFGLEYYFFGSNPLVPHVTNLGIHVLNIIIVYSLLHKLTPQLKTLNVFILAVFALHPLQGELLGWLSTRSTLIVSFFLLLSCLYYSKFLKKQNTSNKYLWFSLLFFVGALFSKASAIVLPLILLLIDYLFKRKFSIRLLLEKTPFFIGSLVIGIVSLVSRKIVDSESGFSTYYNWYEKLSISSQSVFLYFKKSLFADDLFFFYGYPYRIGEDGTIGFSFLIAPLFIALIAIFCWIVYRKISIDNKRLWVFGLVFFLINISIVINIVSFTNSFFSERYMYIGIIGIYISISTLLHAFIKNTPLLRYGIYTLLAIFLFHLGSISHDRADIWKSDITLWSYVEKFKIQSSEPYRILGKIYAKNKNYDKAINYYNNGISINPYSSDLYYWRSMAILETGDLKYALKDLNRVISSKHKLKGDAFYQKSLIFKKINLQDSAQISLDSAKFYTVQLAVFEDENNSLNINRFQQLEKITLEKIDSLIKIKDYENVLENYETLTLIVPKNINYQIEKGKIESQLQKWNTAILTFKNVIEVSPKNEIARLNRAYANYMTKKNSDAILDYTFVIKDLAIERSDIYYFRALAYFNNKQTLLGCKDIDKAKELGYIIPPEIQDKICK